MINIHRNSFIGTVLSGLLMAACAGSGSNAGDGDVAGDQAEVHLIVTSADGTTSELDGTVEEFIGDENLAFTQELAGELTDVAHWGADHSALWVDLPEQSVEFRIRGVIDPEQKKAYLSAVAAATLGAPAVDQLAGVCTTSWLYSSGSECNGGVPGTMTAWANSRAGAYCLGYGCNAQHTWTSCGTNAFGSTWFYFDCH